MKIQVTEKTAYELTIGGEKVLFTVASTWNGLTELQDAKGRRLLVAMPGTTFSSMFAACFNAPATPQEVTVIGGSVEMIGALMAETVGQGETVSLNLTGIA
jgi:hypothetical protein